MLKGLTTITFATGATVLALSLSSFADDSTVAKDSGDKPATIEATAELPHPAAPPSPSQDAEKVAPTAPSAPSGPFAQATKEEGKASTKSTVKPANAEITAPSGPFPKQNAVEKPNAPQQPVLSETTKKDDEAIPAEPIPVAPQIEVKGEQEQQATSKVQAYAEPLQVSIGTNNEVAPAKPEAPTSMKKPVEMTPPQPEKNTSGNGSEGNTGNTSSMNMPSMNMNMPQINMPAMNMKMPETSMGTTMTPQAVAIPVPVQQPATSAEH